MHPKKYAILNQANQLMKTFYFKGNADQFDTGQTATFEYLYCSTTKTSECNSSESCNEVRYSALYAGLEAKPPSAGSFGFFSQKLRLWVIILDQIHQQTLSENIHNFD